MENISVPEVLSAHRQIGDQEISFVHYRETAPVGRNLISFSKCAISFILTGQKDLYRHADRVVVNQNEGVIIPNGNSIIAERKLDSENYSSLVVFFPKRLAANFLQKHKVSTQSIKQQALPSPGFIKFEVTSYLAEYINQLLGLIGKQVALSPTLAVHKLEELLLILTEDYPEQLTAIFNSAMQEPDQLKMIVERNLLTGLNLPELAFLANRSLASFKRDFEKAYGCSPGKYIRERKLEIAAHDLMEGKRANDISVEMGYENLSNFNTAFKRQFRTTPNAYQAGHLI